MAHSDVFVVYECSSPKGSPAPTMRWFKDGLEVPVNQSELGVSQVQNGSLVIGSASGSQSGHYKCVAVNEAGSAERRTRLKVNGETL